MSTAASEKQAYWQSVLRRQKESGLSVRQFCMERELSQASFYRWKQKIADDDRPPGGLSRRNGRKLSRTTDATEQAENSAVFIPVRLNAAAGGVLEVVHPRGHVVRVPAIFDEDSLRQVLDVLDGQGDA
jgi:hypothetical protein